jgi:hypothetical protein
MQRVPFIVKDLSVHRMPGFSRGMEPFRALSPNINIIAGPNASGKSSTARVIQSLIWKGGAVEVHAEGSVMTGDTRWEITLDGGRRKIQREGIDDEFTGIPSPDSSGRYMLALHDLISANDSDLARHITRESVGGFDLDQARDRLGYSNLIKNRGAGNDYNEAVKKYNLSKSRQEELKKQEERLRELHLEKAEAERAAGLASFYGAVRDYLSAKLDFESKSSLLEKFPDGIEKVSGDEYKNIEALDLEIEDAQKEIENAGILSARTGERLSALNLPSGGMEQVVTEELDLRVRELERLERETTETDKRIAALQIEETQALGSIGASAETAGWEGLKLDDVTGLDRFFQRFHQYRSERQFYRARMDGLEKVAGAGGPAPVEKLKEGIKLLSCWLQEERSITGLRRLWVPVLVACGIVSSLSVLIAGGWGLLAVLTVVAAGIFAWNDRRAPENSVRQSDYEKTGLRQPGEWETDRVAGLLYDLVSDLALAEKSDENLRDTAQCRKQLDWAEEKLAGLREEADRLLERLKALPGLPGERLEDYDGLHWFIVNVISWQKCHTALLSCIAARDEIMLEHKKTLTKFNELAVNYVGGTASDAAGARARLQKLIQDASTWKDCTDEITRLDGQVIDKKKQVERALKRQKEIYEKLGIENGLKDLVLDRVSVLEEYKDARQQLLKSEALFSEKQSLMSAHSLFAAEKEQALALAPDEIYTRIKSFDEEAQKRDEIQETIVRIETEVNSVKKGHDLETALKERDEAEEDLVALFERNLISVTGQLLVDSLKRETRDQNQPKVFKRASEVFTTITRGRYELRLDPGDASAFRAYDTVLKLGQDLGELSTGTRIQLVLAVRLAFIETQESAVRLPVLADELLANCDDIRASAIIEALVGISREGRQIFYFTAQGDEVARWKSYLDDHSDVPLKIIHLTGHEGRSTTGSALPGFGSFDLVGNIPQPDGAGRNEYRDMLGVPRFSILEDGTARLHLWYLVEDNKLLYNCLKNGISRWGQLESFLSAGCLDGFDEKLKDKLEKKVRLLERFCELYCRGRSRPVTGDIIRQSGAVSGNHIDKVIAKLEEVDYDPEKLVNALKKGEVPRFQKVKATELKQFFIKEEYINDQESLSKEDILLKLNAYLSTIGLDPVEAERFLKEIEP